MTIVKIDVITNRGFRDKGRSKVIKCEDKDLIEILKITDKYTGK